MRTSYVSSPKSWARRLGVHLPSEPPDAQALLAAIARGDRQALGQLYLHYACALRSAATAVLASTAEAEDLVHDVFYEAWHKAHLYQPARGCVGSWLLVRLRSRALDRIRSPRLARMVSLERARLDDDQIATNDSPAASYLNLVTSRNLAALPASQQRLLRLLFYRELTAVEAAGELRIPLGTVRSRLRRTLGSLRAGASAAPRTQAERRDSATAALAVAQARERPVRLRLYAVRL